MNSIFESDKIKIAIADFDENNGEFKDLTNKKLKQEFKSLGLVCDVEKIRTFFYLISETIKRLYNYKVTKKDFEIFLKISDKTCLNVADNNDVFYPFLIYSIVAFAKNESFYSIYMNNFLMVEHYIKSKILYDFLKMDSSLNDSPFNRSKPDMKNNCNDKTEIYNNSIIFTGYEEILFDHILNENLKKEGFKLNMNFDNAFIFDADKIICDLENCTFKAPELDLEPDSVKISDFFKKFNNISGVSQTLFIKEQKALENYGLKTENISSNGEIFDFLQNPTNFYFKSREQKIEKLSEKAAQLQQNGKATVIDIESKDDLTLLEKALKEKNVDYTLVDNDTFDNAGVAASILNKSRVTVLCNLIGAFLKPVYDDTIEYKAKIKKYCRNIGYNPGFGAESHGKNDKITDANDFYLFFASHYLELENEFLIINNYFKTIPLNNIIFCNCSGDEIFKRFRLDKIKILNITMSNGKNFLFKMISNFIYNIKKRMLYVNLPEKESFLIYLVNHNNSGQNKFFKINVDDPCYCNSGKKFINCHAKS